jgi:hypothetical protein
MATPEDTSRAHKDGHGQAIREMVKRAEKGQHPDPQKASRDVAQQEKRTDRGRKR